ncbi:ribonuclease Z [Scopulibacillus darangshiensis]|uniref:Ribonuclease Z n=1 Tax=Scopulibacillus darangshiensis TaxID=442528 RepID=A0A4R2P9J7_9BACL|nr:MBL fold metallo-hydrolase [Scopulibacillus darangshiensis]TCP30894.1 ribonuclease Z [Scopulibacillus darangshiensis]
MDKLSVTMLGTGSPRPDLERSGSAQVLTINDTAILIDCGEGTTSQLMKAGIAPEDVNHLWLTHLHSDHVLGYGQFLLGGWARGRRKLTVVGPVGTKAFHETIINMFKEDIEYRVSLGRPSNGVLDVEVIEVEKAGEIETDIPAKVTADFVVHNVITLAYRFDVNGKAVVFSGDTAPVDRLVELSRGAHTLIHDACLSTNVTYDNPTDPELQKIWAELQKEHSTPAQAAGTAKQAGVKQLILTHFLPNTNGEKAHREASEEFSGKVIVGKDLEVIDIV